MFLFYVRFHCPILESILLQQALKSSELIKQGFHLKCMKQNSAFTTGEKTTYTLYLHSNKQRHAPNYCSNLKFCGRL